MFRILNQEWLFVANFFSQIPFQRAFKLSNLHGVWTENKM